MRAPAILLFALLQAGCVPSAVPPPAPVPPARTSPLPPPPRTPAPVCVCPGDRRAQRPQRFTFVSAQGAGPRGSCSCIRICVVRSGVLVYVPARYNTATGDTTDTLGIPFRHSYPVTGEYASVAGWYVNREPITWRGRRYTRFLLPRVLGLTEVVPVGAYRGVGVYAEAADTASAVDIVYLPTRPGCEFQPYQAEGRDSVATSRGHTPAPVRGTTIRAGEREAER